MSATGMAVLPGRPASPPRGREPALLADVEEIQQAAFQAGFARNDGFVFLLFGILQFHIGLRVTPVAKGEHGYFDVPRVLQALSRGAACKLDFSDRFDFFRYAPEDLNMLRARWGVAAVQSSAS